jgi:hypothetical protein
MPSWSLSIVVPGHCLLKNCASAQEVICGQRVRPSQVKAGGVMLAPRLVGVGGVAVDGAVTGSGAACGPSCM